MRRLRTLAAALLMAAPMFAADAPKTANPQTQPAATQPEATQDSPLVAAAKRAAKKRTGKTTVITNETLAKNANGGITTTDSQPAINLPSPDAALIAMQNGTKPQSQSGSTTRPSPADAERQRRAAERASRAEDAGPYSDSPHGDEVTIAQTANPSATTTQNPSSSSATQNPTYGQTQNPQTGQAQSPDSMHKKP